MNTKFETKKKLILFMPFIGGGGVEKNLYLISNYLSSKIEKIFLITSSKKYSYKFNKKIIFITPGKYLSESLNIRIKYFICLYILFKFLLKNKNSTVFAFQANIYCVIICKLLGIKVITRSNSSPSGWDHNSLKTFVYKTIINFADLTIVNSKEFKKEMLKKYNISTKCIYNPLNKKEIFKKAKVRLNSKIFGKEKLKILNIGRLTDQKDHITLIKSLKILEQKNIKFNALIIGRGENKLKLTKYINNYKLKKQVSILGFIENPYPYIKKCNLFILTSKYEGLPNVLLEAAVLKKFIISSNCPTGPGEILDNGKGGYLFNVGDFKSLSKKILDFQNKKKEVKKKIIHNYKLLNRFDYNSNLKRYFNAIKKFL